MIDRLIDDWFFFFLTVVRLLQGIFPQKRKISWVLEFLGIDPSYIPGWPQIHQVANDSFHAQSLLLPPLRARISGVCHPAQWGAGPWTPGLWHARLMLYQLSYIARSHVSSWGIFFFLSVFSLYSPYLLALHVVKKAVGWNTYMLPLFGCFVYFLALPKCRKKSSLRLELLLNLCRFIGFILHVSFVQIHMIMVAYIFLCSRTNFQPYPLIHQFNLLLNSIFFCSLYLKF